jgi:hypothetical protein
MRLITGHAPLWLVLDNFAKNLLRAVLQFGAAGRANSLILFVWCNPYGVVLDEECLRWAAAESVSEAVIAAICLLETRSVDEIVARLTPVELEQVINIVGRCPRCYPPGAYDALKGHRRTPLPKPQPDINPSAERLKRSAEQTKPAIQHTQRWMPPRRFAGVGAMPLSASQRATANRYGITLDRAWTEWAAKQGLSETVAAALYLISENRKIDEVVVKLTPGEIERVIDFVQCWPDRFPPDALVAPKHSRPTSSLEPSTPSAACWSPDAALTRGNMGPTRAYRPAVFRTEVPQPSTERATPMNAKLWLGGVQCS